MSGVGWEYHWNKDSKHRITNPELTIDSVSVNDTGDYHCKAQRGDFSVDSETLQVRVQGESIIYFFIIISVNVNIIPIALCLQCLSKIPKNCINILGSVLSTLSDLILTTFSLFPQNRLYHKSSLIGQKRLLVKKYLCSVSFKIQTTGIIRGSRARTRLSPVAKQM